MSSPDYFLISNGPAITQYPEDSLITYCLVSCFLLLCALPLITYFKNGVLQTFACIRNSIKHTYFYITYIFESLQGLYTIWKEFKQDQHHQQPKTGNSLVQISPQPEELLMEVREQLIPPSFTEQIPSIQDLHQDSQVHETEHLLHLHTPNISVEWTYSPLVICNDQAFTEFVQGEERCLKFINQDLIFLQSSSIPSTFSNISHTTSTSAKAKDYACIQPPTCISQENNTTCTETIELVLGFTPAEIHRVQAEPKLTIQQLLEIESCKDYVKPHCKHWMASM